MTTPSDDELHILQGEVQKLLGRCLLRIQQYERLIKIIVAHHDISGSVHDLDRVQAERVRKTASKTLGTLVDEFIKSHLVSDAVATPIEAMADAPANTVSISAWVSLPEADFIEAKNGLHELKRLRNNLVHHFIDEHDLTSFEGWRSGRDELFAAYDRIDQHYERLSSWLEGMRQTRGSLMEFVRSKAGRDLLVNGIEPDGKVFWPAAGIVCALREASRHLAVDGWTPLDDASIWIAERHPEQLPAKYGCRSWQQVVHESRRFELRYFEIEGRRSARYREKGQ